MSDHDRLVLMRDDGAACPKCNGAGVVDVELEDECDE